eukprot:COSAG04_NODE_7465_length_1124_cov_1.126829_1_plen_80_part_10
MTATSQSLTILLSAGGGFRLVLAGEGGTVTAVTANGRPVGANATAANSTASQARTQPPPLERGPSSLGSHTRPARVMAG